MCGEMGNMTSKEDKFGQRSTYSTSQVILDIIWMTEQIYNPNLNKKPDYATFFCFGRSG